jgi:hypothetical protein
MAIGIHRPSFQLGEEERAKAVKAPTPPGSRTGERTSGDRAG